MLEAHGFADVHMKVVPVRAGMEPPVIPLGYLLKETAETLLLEPEMLGSGVSGRPCTSRSSAA